MEITTKRIYEQPLQSNGYRVLVAVSYTHLTLPTT